jgi:hypothetical protein
MSVLMCHAPRRPRRSNRTILSETPRLDQIRPRGSHGAGYARPSRRPATRGKASTVSDHPPPGWVPPSANPPPPGEQPSDAPPPGQSQGQSQGQTTGQTAGPTAGATQPGPHGYPYGAPPPWAVPVHKPGVVALRPLRLGDLFDGAFKTIRRNPKAMVGLAALVSTVAMVIPVLLTLLLAAAGQLSFDIHSSGDGTGGLGMAPGMITVATYLGPLFARIATVVLNGMLVRVVAEAVLGRKTTIGEAWASVRGRLLRLFGLTLLNTLVGVLLIGLPVGIALLVGFSSSAGAGIAVGVPLVLLGIVGLVFVEIRWFLLAPPALVLERTGVFASMRRAASLSRRQFWRLFGIVLLTSLVVGLASEVVAIPLGIIGAASGVVIGGTGGGLAVVYSSYLSQIIVGAITTPFTSGVVALQYVDQRIRKEGLDVSLIAAAQQPTGSRS